MPASQAVRAVLALREMIMGGSIAPGERLYEVQTAHRLGISRTPVREALAQLGQEGLLERASGGGYLVRRFAFAEVADAIEVRGVMEGTALRLAAERGAEPDILAEMRRLADALDPVTAVPPAMLEIDSYLTLNAAFHDALARLPGSALLAEEVRRASRLPFASPSAFLDAQVEVPAFRASLAGAQAQHRAMLEAVAAREGARAEALAREHARLARRNLEYVLTTDQSLKDRIPGLGLVAE